MATKNPGKFREIKEALAGLNFRLIFLRDLAIDDHDFVEDGDTFEDNACKKASYYYAKAKAGIEGVKAGPELLVLAEDSGILVDALAGELGVKTRRWGAGEKVSDEEWIKYFLEKMKNVPLEKRGAEFVCCACLLGEGIGESFKGETKGHITERLEAPVSHGIPLSSCFKPDGLEAVYASLGSEEKNKISHRGKAMAGVRKFLLSL